MVDMAHIAGLVAAGAHPSPVPVRRRRDLHHAQDAARPARRLHPVQGGVRRRRSTRRCSPACRAARSSTSSPPRRWRSARRCSPSSRTYIDQVVDQRARRWARRWSRRAAARLGRHRQPPMLVDLRPAGLTGKDAEQPARRGRHHRQQERDPQRPAEPVRHERHPRRLAGDDHARLHRGRVRTRSAASIAQTRLQARRRGDARRHRATRSKRCSTKHPLYPEL